MRRRRRQHGLSMNKRRRRRVRRHRRFSVPGEVREVGFLVDGDWPVWERLPRPGPPAQRPQSQALRGTLPGRGQGCPAVSPAPGSGTCQPCGANPRCQAFAGAEGRGRGRRGRSAGDRGGRPPRAQQVPTPKPRAASRGSAWPFFRLFRGADSRGDP